MAVGQPSLRWYSFRKPVCNILQTFAQSKFQDLSINKKQWLTLNISVHYFLKVLICEESKIYLQYFADLCPVNIHVSDNNKGGGATEVKHQSTAFLENCKNSFKIKVKKKKYTSLCFVKHYPKSVCARFQKASNLNERGAALLPSSVIDSGAKNTFKLNTKHCPFNLLHTRGFSEWHKEKHNEKRMRIHTVLIRHHCTFNRISRFV